MKIYRRPEFQRAALTLSIFSWLLFFRNKVASSQHSLYYEIWKGLSLTSEGKTIVSCHWQAIILSLYLQVLHLSVPQIKSCRILDKPTSSPRGGRKSWCLSNARVSVLKLWLEIQIVASICLTAEEAKVWKRGKYFPSALFYLFLRILINIIALVTVHKQLTFVNRPQRSLQKVGQMVLFSTNDQLLLWCARKKGGSLTNSSWRAKIRAIACPD